MTHDQPIRDFFAEPGLIRVAMQNQIVNRDNEGNRAEEGNVKVWGKEEVDVCLFDYFWECELFLEGIVGEVCSL